MITGAVLGSPISHSLSPVLHNAAYATLGIAGSYSAIEVASGGLQRFISTQGENFNYLSLTMPLKEEALELAVDIDVHSARIQSGNTLYQGERGWHLTSTDGSGFLAALQNAGIGELNSVLVLGAGGTARAITGALDSVARTIAVMGRTSAREAALSSCVSQSQFSYLRWSLDVDFNSFDLVINTTPAGAADTLTTSVQHEIKPPLFDVIYKPWPTELAQRWSNCGGLVINGLELLLYQGIDQLEIVLNRDLNRDSLAPILRQALTQVSQ